MITQPLTNWIRLGRMFGTARHSISSVDTARTDRLRGWLDDIGCIGSTGFADEGVECCSTLVQSELCCSTLVQSE